MERYLKEEPKSFVGNRKLPCDNLDTSWDLFAPPESPLNGSWKVEVNPLCLNKLNLDQHMDSLSTISSSSSCSRLSWDTSLSYAVLVKNEPIDTDYEDNSDSYEDVYSSSSEMTNNKFEKQRRSSAESQNAIKFTIVARSQLTPPSSPEPNSKNLDIKGNNTDSTNNNSKSLVRMTMNPNETQISRNAIVKLTTGKSSSIGVARLIQVHPKFDTETISDSKAVNIISPPCMFNFFHFYIHLIND